MKLLDIGYQKIQMRYFWIRIFFSNSIGSRFFIQKFCCKIKREYFIMYPSSIFTHRDTGVKEDVTEF